MDQAWNRAESYPAGGKTRRSVMPYTIRTKTSGSFGSFSVVAGDSREALDVAKGMGERGIEEIQILDENGAVCNPTELERIVGATNQ